MRQPRTTRTRRSRKKLWQRTREGRFRMRQRLCFSIKACKPSFSPFRAFILLFYIFLFRIHDFKTSIVLPFVPLFISLRLAIQTSVHAQDPIVHISDVFKVRGPVFEISQSGNMEAKSLEALVWYRIYNESPEILAKYFPILASIIPPSVTYNVDIGVLEAANNNIVKLFDCNSTLYHSCHQSYNGYDFEKNFFATLRVIQPGKPNLMLNFSVSQNM